MTLRIIDPNAESEGRLPVENEVTRAVLFLEYGSGMTESFEPVRLDESCCSFVNSCNGVFVTGCFKSTGLLPRFMVRNPFASGATGDEV